jgi:Flp pilus assembly protein TadD
VLHLGDGDPVAAVDFFRRSTTVRPDDARLWGQLGVAQQRAGNSEAAEAAYRKALELDEDDAELRLNHGITLQELDRLAEAIREYYAAARIAPGSPAIQNYLGNALLAAGDADGALDTTDRCLSLDPGNTAALSSRAIALSRLGRADDARELVDTDLLVRQVEIEAPAGFDSLRCFNQALADHVLADESLTFEPEGHATRKGGHTRDLLRGNKGPIEHLERIVTAAVEEYRGRLDLPDGHPFPGSLPEITRLAMWAVVMEPEGHQLPHIHPAAWLSGVYYVSLPSSMGSGENDYDGWIEFGLPPEELQGGRLPDQVRLEPQEGRMILFPSYFYHRTIPFRGDERRICIAFDVLRRQRRP